MIEWTHRTWNPVRGCSRVSEGCRNCYAERIAARYSGTHLPFYGFARSADAHGGIRWTGRVELIREKLDEPLGWKEPQRVFVNSMSDLFHEKLANREIARVFATMADAKQHTFQVLTKRASRMLDWTTRKSVREESPARFSVWPLPNVWLGVSVEDQATADERIPPLLQTPAAIRFVSYEPALGPVDFSSWLNGREEHGSPFSDPPARTVGGCVGWTPPLDWLIVGGESGPGARPFDVQWARDTVEQCRGADVPVFVKQLGTRPVATHADLKATKIGRAHV